MQQSLLMTTSWRIVDQRLHRLTPCCAGPRLQRRQLGLGTLTLMTLPAFTAQAEDFKIDQGSFTSDPVITQKV